MSWLVVCVWCVLQCQCLPTTINILDNLREMFCFCLLAACVCAQIHSHIQSRARGRLYFWIIIDRSVCMCVIVCTFLFFFACASRMYRICGERNCENGHWAIASQPAAAAYRTRQWAMHTCKLFSSLLFLIHLLVLHFFSHSVPFAVV